MIRFIIGVFLAALAGAAYGFGAPLLPYAQAILAAAIVLAIVLYILAAYGAPRAPLVSHLYGLGVAALALWCAWVVWSGIAAGGQAADFDLMLDGADHAAGLGPGDWIAHVEGLSQTFSFMVGGFDITGARLLNFWIAEAALVLSAGLLGGHAGRRVVD